jgi:hypothetical protein
MEHIHLETIVSSSTLTPRIVAIHPQISPTGFPSHGILGILDLTCRDSRSLSFSRTGNHVASCERGSSARLFFSPLTDAFDSLSEVLTIITSQIGCLCLAPNGHSAIAAGYSPLNCLSLEMIPSGKPITLKAKTGTIGQYTNVNFIAIGCRDSIFDALADFGTVYHSRYGVQSRLVLRSDDK